MITLSGFLMLSIFLFAFIGLMRGVTKEFLVTATVLLAFFVLGLLEGKVKPVQHQVEVIKQVYAEISPNEMVEAKEEPPDLGSEEAKAVEILFWMRVLIFGVIVFFGYQTPRFRTPATVGKVRAGLSGLLLGALNGFLIVGSVWYFLHEAYYLPLYVYVKPPTDHLSLVLLKVLPPVYLQGFLLYVLLALSLIIVFVFVV